MKIEGKNRGGGETTPVTTTWPEAGKKVEVLQQNKYK